MEVPSRYVPSYREFALQAACTGSVIDVISSSSLGQDHAWARPEHGKYIVAHKLLAQVINLQMAC